MKIFDFSNAVRGDQIAEVHHINGHGTGWHPLDKTPVAGEFWEIRDYMYCGHLLDSYHGDDTWYIPATLLKQFGVEAICFCTGEAPEGGWEWRFMCTKAWARQSEHTPITLKPSTFATLMTG